MKTKSSCLECGCYSWPRGTDHKPTVRCLWLRLTHSGPLVTTGPSWWRKGPRSDLVSQQHPSRVIRSRVDSSYEGRWGHILGSDRSDYIQRGTGQQRRTRLLCWHHRLTHYSLTHIMNQKFCLHFSMFPVPWSFIVLLLFVLPPAYQHWPAHQLFYYFKWIKSYLYSWTCVFAYRAGKRYLIINSHWQHRWRHFMRPGGNWQTYKLSTCDRISQNLW